MKNLTNEEMRPTTSASNLARRELCPGSHAAEEGLPEQDSEQSSEGTLLHALDARPDADAEARLTTEQREVLSAARKIDEEIFSVIKASVKLEDESYETYEEGWEKKLFFRTGIRPLFSGHCDRWRYYPRMKLLVLIDKKFGRLEVTPAEANIQLRAYAVMGAGMWDCDAVVVAINQPRLRYEDRLSIAEYRREDIPAARDHLKRIWDACNKPDAPRIASEDACRYCKAKLTCDAYRAKYEWLAEPSQSGKDAYVSKLVELDEDGLDRVWRAVTFAALIREAAKTEIMRRIEAGGMAMYETSDTGATSTIADTVAAAKLLRGAGLTDEDLVACSSFSKERLAVAFKDRNSLSSLAEAKRELKELLKPVLVVEKKSPSIRRLNAARRILDNASDAELFPR